MRTSAAERAFALLPGAGFPIGISAGIVADMWAAKRAFIAASGEAAEYPGGHAVEIHANAYIRAWLRTSEHGPVRAAA